MLRLVLLAILIYSFWNISFSSMVFLVIATIFNIWLYSTQYLGKIEPDKSKWTEKEIDVLRKYHLYFQFPFTSKFNSSTASAIYIFGTILVVLLLWHGYWIKAIIMAINALASALISSKLNPRFYLHDAVERQNKYQYHDEMIAVDSVCDKILKKQKENIDEKFKEKEDKK